MSRTTGNFYPRPPRGGRLATEKSGQRTDDISIHALREEGDRWTSSFFAPAKRFLSTPSARRATRFRGVRLSAGHISIHALREEGDGLTLEALAALGISIHALREEGDCFRSGQGAVGTDFYPRPPRGGRPVDVIFFCACKTISIHALREEGDGAEAARSPAQKDFYPRPPRGGRRYYGNGMRRLQKFLSTPSARRATAKTEKNISAFVSL